MGDIRDIGAFNTALSISQISTFFGNDVPWVRTLGVVYVLTYNAIIWKEYCLPFNRIYNNLIEICTIFQDIGQNRDESRFSYFFKLFCNDILRTTT